MRKMGTTYSIELSYESGEEQYVPLTATNDEEAVTQIGEWLDKNDDRDCRVYLAFDRRSDGQHGYINRSGASPTGKSWRLREE